MIVVDQIYSRYINVLIFRQFWEKFDQFHVIWQINLLIIIIFPLCRNQIRFGKFLLFLIITNFIFDMKY